MSYGYTSATFDEYVAYNFDQFAAWPWDLLAEVYEAYCEAVDMLRVTQSLAALEYTALLGAVFLTARASMLSTTQAAEAIDLTESN